MVREARQNEDGDRKVRELINAQNSADHVIWQAQILASFASARGMGLGTGRELDISII
jgi:hypothetical protein